MTTKDKLLTMLSMQNKLNILVHPEWHTQNFPWTRAIMVEGVEALEHYGWKWWKRQTPDMPQLRIELVDIWHFVLSYYIEHYSPHETPLADHLEQVINNGAPLYMVASDPAKCLEILIGRAALGEPHMFALLALMEQCNLPFDDLYRLYIAKNVLNAFRQDNGYKAGTYIKIWDGVEDNVALAVLMALKPDATPDQLRLKLESVYAKAVVAAEAPV